MPNRFLWTTQTTDFSTSFSSVHGYAQGCALSAATSAQAAGITCLPHPPIGASLIRPRDTAARKTGETRQSSEPARLSDPGDRTSSEARHEGQDQGSRTTKAHADDVHGEPDRDRWTTQGLGRAVRRRPGARQDTADHLRGLPRRCGSQGPTPQWPSPTRTWRGDEASRSAGEPRPLAQFRGLAIARDAVA